MCFYSCYAISNEAPVNQQLYSYHAVWYERNSLISENLCCIVLQLEKIIIKSIYNKDRHNKENKKIVIEEKN